MKRQTGKTATTTQGSFLGDALPPMIAKGCVGPNFRTAVLMAPPDAEAWTADRVEQILAGAYAVVLAQSLAQADLPPKLRSGMPDVVRTMMESYGSIAAVTRMANGAKLEVTGKQIDLADQVIGWPHMLGNDRKALIVIGRAMGKSWRTIGNRVRLSHTYIRRTIYPGALTQIVESLERLRKDGGGAPADFQALAEVETWRAGRM